MKPSDWKDHATDIVAIVAITVLCGLKVADMTLWLAVVGPMVGAKAVQRAMRGKNGTDIDPASGSAVMLLLGVGWTLLRRGAPAALALLFVGVVATSGPAGCGLFGPAESPKAIGCVERYVACVEAFPPGHEHRAEYDACAERVDAECLRAGTGGAGGLAP